MSGFGWGKARRFTIEDAFEEEPEDAIRVYGSTLESRPLNAAAEKYRVGRGSPGRDPPPPPAGAGQPAVQFAPDGTAPGRNFDDSASHDSESLIGGQGSADGLPLEGRHWWAHPKVRDNRKVVVCAFVLMVVGLLLLSAGIVIAAVPIAGFQSFVFVMAGTLCFIPGAYHIAFIYLAVKGRRGYSFHQLPLFN